MSYKGGIGTGRPDRETRGQKMYGHWVVSTRPNETRKWFEVGTFETRAEAEDVANGHRFHHDVEASVDPYED